jgi:hypothetical protein
LPERVFVRKLEKAGFREVAVQDTRPMGIDDCARYPLFTLALIAAMRRLIRPERQDAVARSAVFTARRP